MTEIKRTKRYPQSRTEDIVDAYMRGWNDALDAVQNGKFHIADTPQTDCDTCKHYKLACELFSEICKYEPTTQTKTQNSNLTFEKDECAKEYEELGLKELKGLINADRKTENSSEKPNNCETCRNKGFEGCEQPCLGCGCCGLYEPKTEPMKTADYCDICKRDMCEVCIADATNPYCVPSHYEIRYEPKDEPQTDCAWK